MPRLSVILLQWQEIKVSCRYTIYTLYWSFVSGLGLSIASYNTVWCDKSVTSEPENNNLLIQHHHGIIQGVVSAGNSTIPWNILNRPNDGGQYGSTAHLPHLVSHGQPYSLPSSMYIRNQGIWDKYHNKRNWPYQQMVCLRTQILLD